MAVLYACVCLFVCVCMYVYVKYIECNIITKNDTVFSNFELRNIKLRSALAKEKISVEAFFNARLDERSRRSYRGPTAYLNVPDAGNANYTVISDLLHQVLSSLICKWTPVGREARRIVGTIARAGRG